jgi:hypothetical protein
MIVTEVEAEVKSVIWYCGGVHPFVGGFGGLQIREAPLCTEILCSLLEIN